MTSQRFKVELSISAEADLDAIHAYVAANRTVDQADQLIGNLLDKAATLATFALRGPVPSELAALGAHNYHQLSMSPYRIFYEVIGTVVLISLIVDGRRDLPELLARRLLSR